MMDQEAVVARVEGNLAFVEVGGASAGCGRCHETGGCRSGILGHLFCSKPRQFCLSNQIGALPGEHVIVRVAEGTPLRAAILTYVVPLLSLLAGAIAGTVAGESGTLGKDVGTGLGALAGLAVGVLAGLTLREILSGNLAEPMLVRRDSLLCIVSKETCR